MAINKSNAAVSVDFAYEDDRTKESYKVKLHQTNEYGRTISLSGRIGSFEGGDDIFMSLPADLLPEVVDFLRQNNYIQKSKIVEASENKPKLPVLSQKPKNRPGENISISGGLPLPMVDNSTGVNSGPKREIVEDQQEEEQERTFIEHPVESFLSPSIEDLENIENPNKEVEEVEEVEEDGIDMEPVSSDKIEKLKKMAEERVAAAQKAKKSGAKKKIKKSVAGKVNKKIAKKATDGDGDGDGDGDEEIEQEDEEQETTEEDVE